MEDLEWAVSLMAERRERYAPFSPVFWRPAADAIDRHRTFLAALLADPSTIALRSEIGFIIATDCGHRWEVDDFALVDDDHWSTGGADLLRAVWERTDRRRPLRVVTARRDQAKREMVAGQLAVAARWWVKELVPSRPAATLGAIDLHGVAAVLVPAPPVYDPGGPVCLVDLSNDGAPDAARLAEAAAAAGAVVVVVRREGAPGAVPELEPSLGGAGFDNVSEFYEGAPAATR
jgi:hypothetical protein